MNIFYIILAIIPMIAIYGRKQDIADSQVTDAIKIAPSEAFTSYTQIIYLFIESKRNEMVNTFFNGEPQSAEFRAGIIAHSILVNGIIALYISCVLTK